LQADQQRLNIESVPVALLAGGLAKRLGPEAHAIPKALVQVAGRPFIEHQLDLLRKNGVRKIVLCLGHLGDQIEDHLGDGSAFSLDLSYVHDGQTLLGTGGAITRALPSLGDVFWVMYGDSYMDIDYRAVLAHFANQNSALGLMTVYRNEDRWDRSNVIFRNGRLIRYDKRDRTSDMRYIDFGVQILRKEAAQRLVVNRPSDLADLYRVLVSEGKMIGYEVANRFYEIGTPEALEETREFLAGARRSNASVHAH
jgi:NDP-sugar pyrophosphorylase family protein